MENYFPNLSKGSVITFVRKDTGERVEGELYGLTSYAVKLKNVSMSTKDRKYALNPEMIGSFSLSNIVELEVVKREIKANTNQDGNNNEGSSSR
ncbi:unnamed protein product [Arabis nemorensis]|uniref:Lsm14-like N-terminal domain-containing protein n=1 Tax=Arabis nemorensis TaxID=586526 RepID=A0A565AWE9_9BRAS|nr:unnamed protein product [Arabis nemorensis]